MQLNKRAGVIFGAVTGVIFALLVVIGIGAYASGPVHTTPVVRAAAGITGATGDFGVAGNLGVTGTITSTGILSTKAGITATQSTTDAAAITATGNGNGAGGAFTTGAGTSARGITVTMSSVGSSDIGILLTGNTTGVGIQANTTTGYAIFGSATSGFGVAGECTSNSGGPGAALQGDASINLSPNYALRLLADATSPAAPSIFITQQNAVPSGANILGDVYLSTTGGFQVNVTAGTPGTFVTAANLGLLSTAAAAGANQAAATALTTAADFWTITACDGAKGVALPVGAANYCIRVMAQSSTITNTCLVYPNSADNDSINGAAADAAYTQIAGSSLVYCTADGTAWFTY